MSKAPKTLQEAVIHFASYENCHDFMVSLRWGKGPVTCPRCGSENVSYLPNAKVFKCYQKHEKQKFSLKVGTIFEDSPIALEKWLPVVWLLGAAKNGISSWEIHRAVGVTQKTAWFMLHRVRLAMQDEGHGGKLGGGGTEVEIDETYIGGKARFMHASKRAEKIGGSGTGGKELVMGIVERGGKVRAIHVDGRGAPELQRHVRKNVEAGSAIFTDELHSYRGLSADFQHSVIDHAVAYVEGNVHTNTMENFWSLLKRSLKGTYVSTQPYHLFRYLDEQAFRYNNRKPMDDGDRFVYLMRKVVGKRLTFDELTGKTEPRPSEEIPF
jgi:transposase-like protein